MHPGDVLLKLMWMQVKNALKMFAEQHLFTEVTLNQNLTSKKFYLFLKYINIHLSGVHLISYDNVNIFILLNLT